MREPKKTSHRDTEAQGKTKKNLSQRRQDAEDAKVEEKKINHKHHELIISYILLFVLVRGKISLYSLRLRALARTLFISSVPPCLRARYF